MSQMNTILDQYRIYRKHSIELNRKMMKRLVKADVIDKAARDLKLGKNHLLILDTQEDINVLLDYALYELSKNGKKFIQLYQEAPGEIDEIDSQILAASVGATNGLFKLDDISRSSSSVTLNELKGERKIVLTDINLSQTMIEGTLIFFRPIQLPEFTMTSGIGFLFSSDKEQELLKEWNRNSAKRFAKYFRLSKKWGMPTEFRSV